MWVEGKTSRLAVRYVFGVVDGKRPMIDKVPRYLCGREMVKARQAFPRINHPTAW